MGKKILNGLLWAILICALIAYARHHGPKKDDPRLPIPTTIPSVGFQNPIK